MLPVYHVDTATKCNCKAGKVQYFVAMFILHVCSRCYGVLDMMNVINMRVVLLYTYTYTYTLVFVL